MKQVKTNDLLNSYNYNYLKEKYQKENTKWQWIILLGCFLIQMIPTCIVMNLNAVFTTSDWSIWVNYNPLYIGLTFTIGSIVSAILGPYIARLFGKNINMRIIYSIGIIAAMFGFMGYSINAILTKVYGYIPNLSIVLPILWIMYSIAQIGTMIFSGIGINNLISRWWPKQKRGFALGIAFAGGSFGNIWMQQLLKFLSQKFGNVVENYNLHGNQYLTYIILGIMGLIVGLIVVMFICRKPIPPVEMLNTKQFNETLKSNKVINNQTIDAVSPLNTRKYAPYWILCFAFLLIQMGTIHVPNIGLIIKNTICHFDTQSERFSNIVSTGGTILGVSALIGNVLGGIINDKWGPWKSILYAGSLQICAILCLIFSIRLNSLIYIYYLLAGLSAYLYISTPGFINGRLYGAKYSNNHMSIMSIFTAIGFAISNSIMGVLTGSTKTTGTLLGMQTGGNFANLLIFSIVTMGIGVVIAIISSYIIEKKTITGLNEFISSRYTNIINRYWWRINFAAKKILFTNNDYRSTQKWKDKLNKKNQNDHYYHCFNNYQKALIKELKNDHLTKNEYIFLAYIYFFKIINIGRLIKYTKIKNYQPIIKKLIQKDLIETFNLNLKNDQVFCLTHKLQKRLNHITMTLNENYKNIANENKSIIKQLIKINNKHDIKVKKLNNKLSQINVIEINQIKARKYDQKAQQKINKLNILHVEIAKKYQNNLWASYQKEYEILLKIIHQENLANRLQNKLNFKQAKILTKITNVNYAWNFYNRNEIIGHDLLINYYNNKNAIINHLITKKVNKILNDKITIYKNKLLTQTNTKVKIINNEISSRKL